jgi:hypothetical protein
MLDAPTDLPEGAEVSLAIVDDDDMDDDDRAKLHAVLERSRFRRKPGSSSTATR